MGFQTWSDGQILYAGSLNYNMATSCNYYVDKNFNISGLVANSGTNYQVVGSSTFHSLGSHINVTFSYVGSYITNNANGTDDIRLIYSGLGIVSGTINQFGLSINTDSGNWSSTTNVSGQGFFTYPNFSTAGSACIFLEAKVDDSNITVGVSGNISVLYLTTRPI
jgi:hypothetical protein